MSRRSIVSFIVGCLFWLLAVSSLYAQVTTADILGTVIDASGAVVPGVTVTLENLGTRDTRTAKTNAAGDYVFNLVSYGSYSVKLEASGFKTFLVPQLVVAAGDRARVDAQLQIGATSQTLEVTAKPPALQTETSAVQVVVDSQAVQDLPLNGRDFFNLVQIQPGVNSGSPGDIGTSTRPDDRRMTSELSANGQSALYNNNMVDGMDNNESEQGLPGVEPAIDSIAELRVMTNNYTAEVGRASGAVINVITKSGTDNLHGSLYEFVRNDKFDARAFFLPSSFPTPEYRQNQFGGSLGGPIVKDKTFFFVAYEGLRIVTVYNGQPVTNTVPTLAEEENPGNFSDIGGPVVPTSQINPTALNFFKLFPAPNVPGILSSPNNCGPGCTPVLNNYVSNPLKTQNGTTFDAKVNHRHGDKDTMFARYSLSDVTTDIAGAFPKVNVAGLNILPGGGDINAGHSVTIAQDAQLNEVHAFSPNLLLELNGGFTRINIETVPLNYGMNPSAALGLPNANIDTASSGLTVMSIGNYGTLGNGAWIPILDFNNIFQGNASLAYVRGSHNLKFGAAVIRRQLNYYQPQGTAQGSFTFSNSYTGYSLPYGLSMANFLAGYLVGASRNNTLIYPGYRDWDPSIYAQDNWRATNRLTLNLGVRYELFTPETEAHGRYSNYDPSTYSIVISNNLGTHQDYKDVSPRLGFAATLSKNTVLSGGYGISHYRIDEQSGVQIPNPPYLYGYNCGPSCLPPGATLANYKLPLPTASSINGPCQGTSACVTLSWKPTDYHPAILHMFNVQLQRQVGVVGVLTVGYVGERGRGEHYESNLDFPDPPGPGKPQPPLPLLAQLPFVNAITSKTNDGYSSYNALTAVFSRRFQSGLSVNANYTWAHGLSNVPGPGNSDLDVGHPAYNYGNSDYDIRHHIAVSAVYALPFAKSRTGVAGGFLKGWQINGIAYWQSGQPFTVTDAYGGRVNLPGIWTDRPNIIASPRLAHPTIADWFNTAAFQPQTEGTDGSEPNNAVFGPPDRSLDLSLFKDFRLREGWTLQFRVESYNLTNTANFGQPSSDLTNGNDGQITSTVTNETPRQIQFAFKLLF